MFEFGNAQRAPKVILNETTGEVVSETPGETPAVGPGRPGGKKEPPARTAANGKDGATGPHRPEGRAPGPAGPKGATGPREARRAPRPR